MGTILGSIMVVVAIVAGLRALKLAVKGVNSLFDWIEEKL